ncbi:unnamed protein product [Orchesella dallaii]|uniref:Uncharacterized protein n=1 Tax=Orchesella dallaii TaxID=48710 RepID=A0ABP1RAU5_9HEXA
MEKRLSFLLVFLIIGLSCVGAAPYGAYYDYGDSYVGQYGGWPYWAGLGETLPPYLYPLRAPFLGKRKKLLGGTSGRSDAASGDKMSTADFMIMPGPQPIMPVIAPKHRGKYVLF